jgi:hypothetical protein
MYMKKLLISFFVSLSLVLISTSGFSQAMWTLIFGDKINKVIGSKIDMGIQLALNESTLLNSSSTLFLSSFSFGTYINYEFHKRWNLNTFIAFKSSRGARNMAVSDGFYPLPNDSMSDVRLYRKLGYMDLCPEIQFKISPSLAIGIGPVVSLLVRAHDYYTGTEQGGDVEYTYNIYRKNNAFDVGACFDVQYTFKKGQGIKLNLKYLQGFVSPYKTPSGTKILNTVINIGVGIPTRIIIKPKKKPDSPS